MKLESLEVFCEVVRERSFSRAGSSFKISQSAASQLVAHLEEELGFQLINRKRRPLEPTAAGQLYFQGCCDLLDGYRRMVEDVRRSEGEFSGRVRVASIYSAGLHTLSGYLRSFMSAHDGAHVRLAYLHPTAVYSAVREGEADLGVVSYPKGDRDLEVIPWLEEAMVVACPPTHRLAGRTEICLEDLGGENFVAFDRDLKIRREVDRKLRAAHVRIQVVSEFDNIETIKQALEISDAVSIVPEASIARDVQRGTLAQAQLMGVELRRPVGIVRRKRRELSPTAELFLERLLAPAESESA
ncbi:MAG: LysR family transcriptional regulator [Planctomycetota bacterium]